MGWVYYATYLCYFEVGRTELMRARWRPYREIEDEGYRLPVIESGCRHARGARYDDELEILTTLFIPSAYRLRFDYLIRRPLDSVDIARGFTVHCFLTHGGKIVKVPDDLLNLGQQ